MRNMVHPGEWWHSLLHLFFPRCCVVCGQPLSRGEACICTMCNIRLPRTNYHLVENSPVEKSFLGKIPLVHASSYFFYRKGSDFRKVLHRLKYGGEKEIGVVMGRCMAAELIDSGFFEGVDVIVPVPLHPKKLHLRGYNQSERIARGIAEVTGISVDVESVARLTYTETQTDKSVLERWKNVEGVFALRPSAALGGKHVLIVDDVLTTGATVVACAEAVMQADRVRISVLTLAVAE